MSTFETAFARENARYEALITRKNHPTDFYNGIYTRWAHPVLTREHAPSFGGTI